MASVHAATPEETESARNAEDCRDQDVAGFPDGKDAHPSAPTADGTQATASHGGQGDRIAALQPEKPRPLRRRQSN